ncbi:MAG: hypothetical protein P4L64_08935 [Caulobacteraceae bacterium]|nr:hypothetical protein [Caulobacteraceae bacterium]
MRRLLAIIAAASLLAAAPAALCAPTCQDKDGMTIKCGAPGAMPVGWSLPREPGPEPIEPQVLFGLICFIGGLCALIALMPDFDGWDREEDGPEGKGR